MTAMLKLGVSSRLLLTGALLCLMSLASRAQTSSGQLSISMTVQSSISLVFQNNANVNTPGFCPLTNAGTNNVGLDLGTASFPGSFHSSTCVNYQHIGGGGFCVSSAICLGHGVGP